MAPSQLLEDKRQEAAVKDAAYLNKSGGGSTPRDLNDSFKSAALSSQGGYLELRNNVKTVLVTLEEDDWIFNLNIGNVMHLGPLTMDEMNLHVDNSHELSRDAMLQKIILLTVSYFCVGTELRFLNQAPASSSAATDDPAKQRKQEMQEAEKKRKKELSEMWHA